MTTLREAAQAALTALQTLKARGVWGDFDGVADALKAALVEDALQRFTAVNQELEAALAEPVQEPVAWMFVDDTGMKFVSVDRPHKHCQPLYTAPPQRPAEATTIAEWWADRKRKPLTKEKIRELLDIETEALPSYRSAVEELPERLARAVERAHGIGVDK